MSSEPTTSDVTCPSCWTPSLHHEDKQARCLECLAVYRRPPVGLSGHTEAEQREFAELLASIQRKYPCVADDPDEDDPPLPPGVATPKRVRLELRLYGWETLVFLHPDAVGHLYIPPWTVHRVRA